MSGFGVFVVVFGVVVLAAGFGVVVVVVVVVVHGAVSIYVVGNVGVVIEEER